LDSFTKSITKRLSTFSNRSLRVLTYAERILKEAQVEQYKHYSANLMLKVAKWLTLNMS